MIAIAGLDLAVLVVYLVGVTVWGARLGRGASSATDYFLGGRDLPWVAVMLSVVATETSTLTFLSVPGVAYLGNLGFIQLALGYVIGRVVVALILLPAYYRGSLQTAYALLEVRFGVGTRRFTSGLFMITRLLADSVRLFATAIPLALLTGWAYPTSIAVIGVLTLIYTYVGGIRAVVWVDALQMGMYLVGALVAAITLQTLVPGGWTAILDRAHDAGKLAAINLSTDPATAYTLWAGLVGGAFLSMASHGTDQLIVQRLLTCRDLKSSQKALVGSGVLVAGQFALFLMLGVGLWAFFEGRTFTRVDEVFATFIVEQLPPGVAGLLIAAVFSAAMSSLSSSINSLASASAYDFWGPLRGVRDDAGMLRAGKVFTLIWSALLVGGAIVFIPLSTNRAAVEAALSIASVVYGGLLGAFLLGTLTTRPRPAAAVFAIATGVAVVGTIWLRARSGPTLLAWPWFVVVGSTVTVIVGWIGGLLFPARPPDAGAA